MDFTPFGGLNSNFKLTMLVMEAKEPIAQSKVIEDSTRSQN